jgi:hypothetical protein
VRRVKPDLYYTRDSTANNQFIYEKVFLPLHKEYFGMNYKKEKIYYKITSKNLIVEGSDAWVYKVHNELTNEKLPNISFGSTFNGKRRALQYLTTASMIFRKYLNLVGIAEEQKILDLLDLPVNLVVPFFSKLKTNLLLDIDYLPSEIRYWIDWSNLSGYPKMAFRELKDDPDEWLVKDVPTSPSASWWSSQFKKTFEENIVASPIQVKSLRQFALDRWMWVTSGATTFSHAMINDKVVKTKFGAALSLSDDEILDLVFNRSEKDVIGVFIKPDEKGFKRRLIANVPLGPYIVAAHVLYVIKLFVGSTPSYNKFDMNLGEHLDIVTMLQKGVIAIPLDESSWDYNFSRTTWIGFTDFIEKEFSPFVDVSFFRTFFDQAHWVFGERSGPWNAGMPSGLALTSYLNSWVNYIKQTVIQPTSLKFYAAGDDALNLRALDDDIDMNVLSERYKKLFSAEVKVTQNWKARQYAEFLKTIYSKDGLTGYPARVYSSLIWAIDLRDDGSPATRLNEIASLWKQLYDRIGKPMDEREVAADLARSIKNKVKGFTTAMAKDWLHSPKAFGGFGKIPYNDKVFEWEAEAVKKSKYQKVIIRVPDLVEYVGKFELKIKEEKIKKNVVFKTGPPPKLKEIESVEDWEGRLNGEDSPVKGKYGRMAMQTIPLPEIDFVSTNMMSKLASENKFNVYPNLVGAPNSVNSRLILGSEMLVQTCLDLMRSFRISIML